MIAKMWTFIKTRLNSKHIMYSKNLFNTSETAVQSFIIIEYKTVLDTQV